MKSRRQTPSSSPTLISHFFATHLLLFLLLFLPLLLDKERGGTVRCQEDDQSDIVRDIVAGKRRVIGALWDNPRATIIVSGVAITEYDDDLEHALIYLGTENPIIRKNFSLSGPAQFYHKYPRANIGEHSRLQVAVKDGGTVYLIVFNPLNRGGVAVDLEHGDVLAKWEYPRGDFFSHELDRLDLPWLTHDRAYLSWSMDPKGKKADAVDKEGDWGHVVGVNYQADSLKESLENGKWAEQSRQQMCLFRGAAQNKEKSKDAMGVSPGCSTKPLWQPAAGWVDDFIFVLVDRADGSVFYFDVAILDREYVQPDIIRFSGASFWLDAQGRRVVNGSDDDPYDKKKRHGGPGDWGLLTYLCIILGAVAVLLLCCGVLWWLLVSKPAAEQKKKEEEEAEAEKAEKADQERRMKMVLKAKAKQQQQQMAMKQKMAKGKTAADRSSRKAPPPPPKGGEGDGEGEGEEGDDSSTTTTPAAADSSSQTPAPSSKQKRSNKLVSSKKKKSKLRGSKKKAGNSRKQSKEAKTSKTKKVGGSKKSKKKRSSRRKSKKKKSKDRGSSRKKRRSSKKSSKKSTSVSVSAAGNKAPPPATPNDTSDISVKPSKRSVKKKQGRSAKKSSKRGGGGGISDGSSWRSNKGGSTSRTPWAAKPSSKKMKSSKGGGGGGQRRQSSSKQQKNKKPKTEAADYATSVNQNASKGVVVAPGPGPATTLTTVPPSGPARLKMIKKVCSLAVPSSKAKPASKKGGGGGKKKSASTTRSKMPANS